MDSISNDITLTLSQFANPDPSNFLYIEKNKYIGIIHETEIKV